MEVETENRVLNHDVLFVYDMINRFIIELMHSQSNGVSGLTVHDQTRMASYLNALRVKKDWIMGQPLLDLPETHPRAFPLEPAPEVRNVESESINQLIRLFEALRIELINSQSARLASGLNRHDAGRYDGIVDKMEAFLLDYIAVLEPIDLPESSPAEKLSPAGRSGI